MSKKKLSELPPRKGERKKSPWEKKQKMDKTFRVATEEKKERKKIALGEGTKKKWTSLSLCSSSDLSYRAAGAKSSKLSPSVKTPPEQTPKGRGRRGEMKFYRLSPPSLPHFSESRQGRILFLSLFLCFSPESSPQSG